MTWDLFEHKFYFPLYKNGIQKIKDFLDKSSGDKDLLQDLLLKNGLKFMINQKKITILIKKLESKHQC